MPSLWIETIILKSRNCYYWIQTKLEYIYHDYVFGWSKIPFIKLEQQKFDHLRNLKVLVF